MSDEDHVEEYEAIKKPSESSRQQMETRMTYQYPKGPFRFPLIQDPPKKSLNPNRERDRTQPIPVQKPSPVVKMERKVDKEKEHAKYNQPFRPTTIPSPIYGYKRPEKQTEEYELQESFLKTQDPVKDQQMPAEIELNFTFEAEELDSSEIAKQQVSASLDVEQLAVEDIREDIEEIVEDHEESRELMEDYDVFTSEEQVIVEERVDVETEIEHEEVTHRPPESSEERPKPRSRSQLPFNVLMLKNDRKKWELKQSAQNSQQVTQQSERKRQSNMKEGHKSDSQIEQKAGYQFPPIEMLYPPVIKQENTEWLNEQRELLNETLANFNVNAHVVHVSQGPSVTRFEVQPERGVKVNKITNLSDDIKLSMAAKDIRIEAPIPGKRSVGIEIPNHNSRPVQISEIIGDSTFSQSDSLLTAALGLDISGTPIVTDLQKMPHGLIAGATGSGKSVCVNSILVSLLYKARPEELKLLLIDPKMVELAPYNHIPHLVSPVITDVKAATAALKWAVDEMERRYELFSHASVRNISRFNELAESQGRYSETLPYIVVVIDELADLMMMAPHDVEESICRIAQKARACGIHLLIATQRPSVDVITGLIKANVPTRIAFSVSSQVDSRTIIDVSGAEKLLGRGDMLFLGSGSSKPVRLQGTFVSDEEIDRVIEHVRSQGKPNYLFEQEELLKKAQIQEDEDDLYLESCEFVVQQGSASTSLLQRQFRIGYNRAARLIDMMEQQGVISEARGSKPREVLMTQLELEVMRE